MILIGGGSLLESHCVARNATDKKTNTTDCTEACPPENQASTRLVLG